MEKVIISMNAIIAMDKVSNGAMCAEVRARF
jgi:hypothetical protein